MEKEKTHGSLAPAVILSCIVLILAIGITTLLQPPTNRQNPLSPDLVTINKQGLAHISSPGSKRQLVQKTITLVTPLTSEQRQQCYHSCHLELVESLPENLTLSALSNRPLNSTFESWRRLINLAGKRIVMAAYKSSFRGKHILSEEHSPNGRLGDEIFDLLKTASVDRAIRLEAVENYPPKDRGDNEDALALSELGLLERRRIQVNRLFSSGIMHSKFFIIDDSHFYLGSANFDWRSLNQKMELGVHVENCPCLANDLRTLYDSYWTAAVEGNDETFDRSPFSDLPALTSKSNPLRIRVGGVDTQIYLAASPRQLHGAKRDWDLDAIVNVIDEARHRLDIHVMDYAPMYAYQKQRKFWPVIDYAIRRAAVERGVKVRFLTAALHFVPESLLALRSLRLVGASATNGGKIDVKIINIPAVTASHRAFARDRRTHRKFVVNDDSLLIGTSNWLGDYFTNTTGAAIVARQQGNSGETTTGSNGSKLPLIDQARELFERDWNSVYASDLDAYVKQCYHEETGRDLCKVGLMAYQRVASGNV